MKTTQFLALTTLLVAVTACSQQDNQESIESGVANTPPAEKPMEVMPSKADVKPAEMLPNEIKVGDTTTAIEQDNSGRKVIYWYDPMLEDRHFSKSGQSPFMDMKLAPYYADDASKGN